jgi:hypothetical protein
VKFPLPWASALPRKIVTLLPMTVPLPLSLPKLHTATSSTPSPVRSASATPAELLPNDENAVPTCCRLPAPSLRKTDTLPVFWRLALTATTSCQPSLLMSAVVTKATLTPPVLCVTVLNPPPARPYRTVIVLAAPGP